MDMNLIELLFSGGKEPADVAEMGNQLVTAGMKCGEEIGNDLSDIIDDIIDAIFE
jgi:hypothetical protein